MSTGEITFWSSLVIGLACFVLTLWFGLYLCAKNDVFFTFLKEGTWKVIMKGGRKHKFIMNVRGHYMDTETGVVHDGDGHKSLWSRLLGIEWIGPPPFYTAYRRMFRWNKIDMPSGGKDTQVKVIPKEEEISAFVYRAPYAIEVKGAETKGKIPLDITIEATVVVTDGDRMLFKTTSWLANYTTSLLSLVRDFTGQRELEEMISMNVEENRSALLDAILGLNNTVGEHLGLDESIGVKTDVINLTQIKDIQDPEAQRITKAKYLAEQTADGVRAEARGKADAIVTIATAEAHAICLRGSANATALEMEVGSLGTEKSQLGILELSRAIRDAKTQTVALGSSVTPVIDIGGNKGGKKPEKPAETGDFDNMTK